MAFNCSIVERCIIEVILTVHHRSLRTRNWIICRWASSIAQCKGLMPESFLASKSHPRSRSTSATRTWPRRAAWCRAERSPTSCFKAGLAPPLEMQRATSSCSSVQTACINFGISAACRKIYCGILILHNSFRQGRTAFLVNSLLREQSRLLHHREQLLPYGKVIQLETVTDNLLVLETALRVLRIPSQEILFFRSNAAGRKISTV